MQKKKIFQLSLGLLFIFLMVGILTSLPARKDTVVVPDHFPESLLEAYTDWEPLEKNSPSLLIFYNTACDHCQYEAKSLSTHSEFKAFPVYWITADSGIAQDRFKKDYASSAPENFHFLQDKNHKLGNALGVSTYPTVFIYGPGGALQHQYVGETKPEAILKYLKD